MSWKLQAAFTKLMGIISDRLSKADLQRLLFCFCSMNLITRIQLETIQENEDIWELWQLLMYQGFLSVYKLEKLEELAKTLFEPLKQQQICEAIGAFKEEWSAEISRGPHNSGRIDEETARPQGGTMEEGPSDEICRSELNGSPGESLSTSGDETSIKTVAHDEREFRCVQCPEGLRQHLGRHCSEIATLDAKQMSEEDKRYLECKFVADSREMMRKFSSFVMAVCSSLKGRVSVDQVVLCLLLIGTFTKPVSTQIPLFTTKRAELKKARSIERVFQILAGYISWFHISPVEHVISEFGSKTDHIRLAQYKQEFCKYVKRRVFNHPHVYGEPDRRACIPLVVKVDTEWERFKISDAISVQIEIAQILQLEPSTLFLQNIEKGCVNITFSIPRFATSKIFPLSDEQEQALSAAGVMELQCGSYHFSSGTSNTETMEVDDDDIRDQAEDSATGQGHCHEMGWESEPHENYGPTRELPQPDVTSCNPNIHCNILMRHECFSQTTPGHVRRNIERNLVPEKDPYL